MKYNLTQLLLDYRNGLVDYTDLLDASIIFVYKRLNSVVHDPKDEWHEFVTSSIQRIERAIEQFDYQGVDFESYLATCLLYYHRSYRARIVRQQENYRIVPAFQNEYNSICVSEPENRSIDNYQLNCYGRLTLPDSLDSTSYSTDFHSLRPIYKRIIIYSLKLSASVRECYMKALSDECKFDVQWLMEKRASILSQVWYSRLRKQTIEDSCSIWFSRLIDAQRAQKSYEIVASDKVDFYRKKEANARQHLHTMSNRFTMIDTTPSHETLASVMNVPKGTIDSSIYYLKVYWNKAEPVIKKIINRL
jgi:hypothetical protein